MSEFKPYRLQCYVAMLPGAEAINQAIVQQYAAVRDDPSLTRSHFFEGRYENVYIPESRLPALTSVLAFARREAVGFLGPESDVEALSVGFWINEMAPGQVTLAHRHDEDGELASAVYYVSVPEDSGALILERGNITARVTPVEGQIVFFPPDLLHEVSKNLSGRTRLSIGMNFGVRR